MTRDETFEEEVSEREIRRIRRARLTEQQLTKEDSQLVIGAIPLQALPDQGDQSQEIERLRNEVKDLRAACQFYLERERAVIKLLSREV